MEIFSVFDFLGKVFADIFHALDSAFIFTGFSILSYLISVMALYMLTNFLFGLWGGKFDFLKPTAEIVTKVNLTSEEDQKLRYVQYLNKKYGSD